MAGVSALAAIALSAADHRDGPLIIHTPTTYDINDLYVFPAPQASDGTVIVMTTNPMAGVMGPEAFLSNAKYELLIDTTGDDGAELTFRVTFSRQTETGGQVLTVTSATGNVRARGPVGQPIAMAGGGRILAGVFDDPFFFDRIGLQQSMSFCGDHGGIDFFRGLNVNAIVLEVPRSTLGSQRIGVWSRIVGSGGQIDRMAHPSLNALLIPESRRDEFNGREPGGDSVFRPDVISSLIRLGSNDAMAASIADSLLPDMLRYDAAIADGFPNGRRLTDDVIDLALAQWTNGRVATDCVSSDSAFSPAFPYLAPANP
jgi:hypothetical protein